MVATTGILAFVSEQAVADDAAVRVLPVPELRMQRTLALVSKRGAPLAPAVRGFVELLLRRGE